VTISGQNNDDNLIDIINVHVDTDRQTDRQTDRGRHMP